MDRNLNQGSPASGLLKGVEQKWMKLLRRKSEHESTVFVCLFGLFLTWESRKRQEWHLGGYNHQSVEKMLRTWNMREESSSLAAEGRGRVLPSAPGQGSSHRNKLSMLCSRCPALENCQWVSLWVGSDVLPLRSPEPTLPDWSPHTFPSNPGFHTHT